MLFPENIGPNLSIDEVAVTNGELYTVVTNKTTHGKKGVLVAMIQGTKATKCAKVLTRISEKARHTVREATLDLSDAMGAIVTRAFQKACLVIDRFHVQQLVNDAVQKERIILRREAMKEENEKTKEAKKQNTTYRSPHYENGDIKTAPCQKSISPLQAHKRVEWTAERTSRDSFPRVSLPQDRLQPLHDVSSVLREFKDKERGVGAVRKMISEGRGKRP